MKPMRPLTVKPRVLTAVTGAALALSLSGCGLLTGSGEGPVDPDQSEHTEAAPQSEQAPASAEASPDEGAMSQTTPTEPADSEPSASKSEDPYKDAARTTSWASDDAMTVDGDGDGMIPAASLEADLVDLFENKFDIKTKRAECEDMKVTKWYGFVICDVIGEDRTYYGTVKLIDHKDEMIKYELLFPGIDKSEVDFED